MFFVYIYSCGVVCVFLFTSLPFFLCWCLVVSSSTINYKQVSALHCVVYVVFVYNFNVKRYKSKTPEYRFSILVTILALMDFNIWNLEFLKSLIYSGYTFLTLSKFVSEVPTKEIKNSAIRSLFLTRRTRNSKVIQFCFICFHIYFLKEFNLFILRNELPP